MTVRIKIQKTCSRNPLWLSVLWITIAQIVYSLNGKLPPNIFQTYDKQFIMMIILIEKANEEVKRGRTFPDPTPDFALFVWNPQPFFFASTLPNLLVRFYPQPVYFWLILPQPILETPNFLSRPQPFWPILHTKRFSKPNNLFAQFYRPNPLFLNYTPTRLFPGFTLNSLSRPTKSAKMTKCCNVCDKKHADKYAVYNILYWYYAWILQRPINLVSHLYL